MVSEIIQEFFTYPTFQPWLKSGICKNGGLAEHFNTPRKMSLEDALEYINDDELVEVAPKSVCMIRRG